jgi:gliding motility-associated-like protein
MRVSRLLAVFLLHAAAILPAQSLTFHSTFDYDAITAYAALTNVIRTGDGGYAFPVMVNGSDFDSVNLTLVKTLANGSPQWTKKLATTSRLAFFSANTNATMIQTSDGGYAVEALVRGPTSASDPSLVVFRLDGAANILWETSFTEDFRLASSIMQTSSGDIVATGTVFDATAKHDFWMGKVDASGNFIWSKEYDFNGDEDYLTSAAYTSDGGFILSGATMLNMNMDIGLIKTDANGDPVWQNRYDALYDEYAIDCRQTSSGDFILTGRAGNPNRVNYLWDICGVRLDPAGAVVWANYYGGDSWDEGYSVTEATDGGFVFATEPESFSGYPECCLMKTDSAGNFEWMKRFTTPAGSFPASVNTTSDGGYILTGVEGTVIQPVPEVFLVKTDQDGNTACAADDVAVDTDPMLLNATAVGNYSASVVNAFSNHSWTQPSPVYGYTCLPEIIPATEDSLFIPNVFSPNDQAPNDLFSISYTGDESLHLFVYDRWGVLMFESTDVDVSWDGRTAADKEATAGTYYYVLNIGVVTYTGFVTLIR